MKPGDDALVVTAEGLRLFVRYVEGAARGQQRLEDKIDRLERDRRDAIDDSNRAERDRDNQVRAYHKALEEHRKLLTNLGVKAKTMPALPEHWERNAKRIADLDDIPF